MTALQRRVFIFLDEWLGIALLCYLHRFDAAAFWPTFVVFVVFVYGLSYPWHWALERAERRAAEMDRVGVVVGVRSRDGGVGAVGAARVVSSTSSDPLN